MFSIAELSQSILLQLVEKEKYKDFSLIEKI